MTASERLAQLAPYLERALEDEAVHEQFRIALRNLRRGSRRARGKSLPSAAQDRKLRGHLEETARALAEAARAIGAPPPKRHRMRRLLLFAVFAGATALAVRQAVNPRGGSHG